MVSIILLFGDKMYNSNLIKRLFELQDLKYKDFHAKLIPTIYKEKIIGIRTPTLRKFAIDFNNDDCKNEFLNTLPHHYYEENNLHAFLIEKVKDFDTAIILTDNFLPYVDNWATCDMLRPKVFAKNKENLLKYIKKWLKDKQPYTVRFGIEMLMIHFLGENFSPNFPDMISKIKSDEYYVKMMIAWYFATALATNYDAVLPYFKTGKLEKWTHNKAIQKALESYRITPEQKQELKHFKIK